MTTPAPVPVLNVSLDKPEYVLGEEIVVTAEVVIPVKNTVTVSGTLPDGTTVTGEATATVHTPVQEDVQFGASDSLGDAFVLQSGSGGQKVLTTTAGASPAPA